MRRRSVSLDAAAVADLHRIAAYIIGAHGLPRTARRYVEAIGVRCMALGDVPIVGQDLGHIEPGLRTIPFKGTVILFRTETDRILIRRIFRHEQDYERALGGSD